MKTIGSIIAPDYTNKNQDLINRCKEGDQKAQFQVYKLYYKAMYNTCMRIIKNPAEAEDIMQESFLAAFEKIGTYSGKVSFGAWLKRIVINRSLDTLRNRRNIIFTDIHSEVEEYFNFSDDSDSHYDVHNELQKLKEAVDNLPEGYRLVTTLYLFEGYDHEEIGKILSISPGTSKSQFCRAKKRLQSVPFRIKSRLVG